MKKLLIICTVLFISCKQQKVEQVIEIKDTINVDSIVERSKKIYDSAIVIQKKSDVATKKVIIRAAQTIQAQKLENLQLKTISKIVTEKIIYKTDTVYIETKKNFWGKEKSKVRVVSDSTTKETTDSTDH